MAEIKLPSLGEGIEKGTIINIMVKVGDTISLEQPLLEVETDKVVVEVPSDAQGTVTAIVVNEGDEISEGSPFIQIDMVDNSVEKLALKEKVQEEKEVIIAVENQEDIIVPQTTTSEVRAEHLEVLKTPISESLKTSSGSYRASPLARKLAREIGVNITDVASIAKHNRISIKDVKTYAKTNNSKETAITPTMNVVLPDFSKWGNVNTQTIPAITKATSKNMSMTWSQIPHAWLQEKVDVTDLEAKRQLHKGTVKEEGGALTITSIIVKVVAKALEEFPILNASLDTQNNQIIFKEYINIGVAVDSDRGLLVPVLRDPNKKGMLQISKNLVAVSQKVKQNKTKPEELEGGTFTISNLGGIGTSAVFPLVNHPQVAILGIAASTIEAIWIHEKFEPRTIMPLTIGFDHRIINGADAARFLKYIKHLLEDWFLWGM